MVKVENSLGCPEPNGASVGRVWDRNALEEDELGWQGAERAPLPD